MLIWLNHKERIMNLRLCRRRSQSKTPRMVNQHRDTRKHNHNGKEELIRGKQRLKVLKIQLHHLVQGLI